MGDHCPGDHGLIQGFSGGAACERSSWRGQPFLGSPWALPAPLFLPPPNVVGFQREKQENPHTDDSPLRPLGPLGPRVRGGHQGGAGRRPRGGRAEDSPSYPCRQRTAAHPSTSEAPGALLPASRRWLRWAHVSSVGPHGTWGGLRPDGAQRSVLKGEGKAVQRSSQPPPQQLGGPTTLPLSPKSRPAQADAPKEPGLQAPDDLHEAPTPGLGGTMHQGARHGPPGRRLPTLGPRSRCPGFYVFSLESGFSNMEISHKNLHFRLL